MEKKIEKIDPKNQAKLVLDFLQTSKLVDLQQPMDKLISAVKGSELGEVAGYVLAWERYVLVVASEVIKQETINPQ